LKIIAIGPPRPQFRMIAMQIEQRFGQSTPFLEVLTFFEDSRFLLLSLSLSLSLSLLATSFRCVRQELRLLLRVLILIAWPTKDLICERDWLVPFKSGALSAR
jgi:hypothetical protein